MSVLLVFQKAAGNKRKKETKNEKWNMRGLVHESSDI